MKRLIVASILLILVFATYFLSLFYIMNTCEESVKLLEGAIEEYSLNENKKAQNLKKYWDKKEKLLSVFVNHEKIDDIEEEISLLNIYSKQKDNALFYASAEQINVLFHQIKEDNVISAHSIF